MPPPRTRPRRNTGPVPPAPIDLFPPVESKDIIDQKSSLQENSNSLRGISEQNLSYTNAEYNVSTASLIGLSEVNFESDSMLSELPTLDKEEEKDEEETQEEEEESTIKSFFRPKKLKSTHPVPPPVVPRRSRPISRTSELRTSRSLSPPNRRIKLGDSRIKKLTNSKKNLLGQRVNLSTEKKEPTLEMINLDHSSFFDEEFEMEQIKSITQFADAGLTISRRRPQRKRNADGSIFIRESNDNPSNQPAQEMDSKRFLRSYTFFFSSFLLLIFYKRSINHFSTSYSEFYYNSR